MTLLRVNMKVVANPGPSRKPPCNHRGTRYKNAYLNAVTSASYEFSEDGSTAIVFSLCGSFLPEIARIAKTMPKTTIP
ncbi:hypothetical protein Rcae01_02358 [Novipirellula caenicola]|uniref:Uncharacterized protein n=1 Tax=Novipirellula caenicola TaxID=1536901 RepID=A0ABP9VQK9_9BACT